MKPEPGQTVTIGRMKGNIKPGDKVYKISSKELSTFAKESYRREVKKIPLACKITIKEGLPVSINVTSLVNFHPYQNLNIGCSLEYFPEKAITRPLDEETVRNQISKTASTPYQFTNITLDLDEDIFLPKLSILNELRRTALENVENYAISKIIRNLPKSCNSNTESSNENIIDKMRTYNVNSLKSSLPKITLLLNILNPNFDYSTLEGIDSIYIPLKYFTNRKYEEQLSLISKKFDTYVYMPTIIKGNYKNLFYANIEKAVQKYNIQGFVISNICNIKLLNDLFYDLDKHFKIIANYTFNVFNSNTVLELKKLGISSFTLSPELDKDTLTSLSNFNYLRKELIVYGRTPVLNMNYCLLGNTNKCYPECNSICTSTNKYYLKDRLNMKFRILPDNIQTVTTVYNSKITSILPSLFNIDFARIDILDESIYEINQIIQTVRNGKRFEGKEYTNGNLNREI